MKVTLTDHTQDPQVRIGRAAAICYDSDVSDEASNRRAIHCSGSGHLATMRFAYATFHIEGISRICSHQIVRVAHAGILQRSQRYVRETGIRFVQPHSLADAPDELKLRWARLEAESRDLYCDLLEAGMKKEDARYTLLASAETELHMTGNFQFWRDFLGNRTSKHAQWEVREVAVSIRDHLRRIAPDLF